MERNFSHSRRKTKTWRLSRHRWLGSKRALSGRQKREYSIINIFYVVREFIPLSRNWCRLETMWSRARLEATEDKLSISRKFFSTRACSSSPWRLENFRVQLPISVEVFTRISYSWNFRLNFSPAEFHIARSESNLINFKCSFDAVSTRMTRHYYNDDNCVLRKRRQNDFRVEWKTTDASECVSKALGNVIFIILIKLKAHNKRNESESLFKLRS